MSNEFAPRVAAGLRLCWVVAQLLLTLAAMARLWLWEHRAEIRQAVVRTVAAAWVAAEMAYRAGRWLRQEIERLNDESAAMVLDQPVAALAPITANLAALRAALERLVARLYPAVV